MITEFIRISDVKQAEYNEEYVLTLCKNVAIIRRIK